MRTKISSITSPLISTLACATLLALLLALPARSAPGDLEPLDLGITGGDVYASAVQPDGKTIIAGNFSQVLGVARNCIARLNADGTLDTSFNPNANYIVRSVAVQTDGKVLLGGGFTTLSPNGGTSVTRNYIARVNSDGTLDTSFNPNANGGVSSVAVQADGKVLLGGNFTSLSPNGGAAVTRWSIARVNADGTLDTGFNPNANGSGSVLGMAVQADGKVLLAGSFVTLAPNGGAVVTRNHIARVNADGTLDTGFNPNTNSYVYGVALQADGKVLLAGQFSTLSPGGGAAVTRVGIARVNADGTLDSSFNPTPNAAVLSVAIQTDGKVLLGGGFSTLSPNGGAAVTRNCIARFNADGTLDTGFNPNANSAVSSVAVQADGKVLLGGAFTNVGGTPRNSFARLANDSTTQSLAATSATQADWVRGGAGPELEQVGFDLSTDGGTTWSPLGAGTRVGTTASWRRTGLSLPVSGHLRARGRTAGGNYNGTSGLIEQVVEFTVAVPPVVTNISPASGTTAGGTIVTITGTGFTGATGATVGGVALTNFSVLNATTITGTTGSSPAGAANVAITGSPNGASSGGTGIFTYLASDPGSFDLLNLGISGSSVSATAVQPDGKTIIGGAHQVLGVARNRIARINADGTLDAGFNPNANGGVNSIAVQADGKVLLGGLFTTLSPNGGAAVTRSCIARVNADGTLDTGFNPYANGFIFSVAVQADGKVLLGGQFSTLSPGGGAPSTRNYIARVNADGTLDTGFNPNANNYVYCIAVQADGKVLLGGSYSTLSPNGGAAVTRSSIARVHADGTLDTGFNPNANGIVRSVAVQADGKVLLGGNFTTLSPNGGGAVTRNRIARVNGDGTLDTGFNPNASNDVHCMVLQADGKVLLGGGFTTLSPNGGVAVTRNRIGRVNADGSLDTIFNPNANSSVFSVALQADGKVLLGGGFNTVGGMARNRFARLINDSNMQTLTATNATQADWIRGGAGPEVEQVSFDLSTNGGTSWIPLGAGSRVGSTANWRRTGLSLPTSGHLRARGRTAGGYYNGSSGLIEQVVAFTVAAAPTVTGISPSSGSTAGGTGVTITGTGFTGATGATVGGVALTGFSVVNATTIIGTTGAAAAGATNVAVIGSPNGPSTGGTGIFTYATPLLNEIALEQAGSDVPTGSTHPFGAVATGGYLERAFIILNTGTTPLTLSGSPQLVAISGSPDFTVTSQPTSADIAPGGNTSFTVRFTPSGSGPKSATLSIANNDSNENPFVIELTGTATTASALFTSAITSGTGLTGDDTLPGAIPFDDGVENLLKYAFNMNLAGPDASALPPGTGTSGLPSITTPEAAPPGTLRFEFLRRKGSGLVYTPKKSTTLGGPSWSSLTASPVVTSIDDEWERVIYSEAPDPVPVPACFGRVEVSIP